MCRRSGRRKQPPELSLFKYREAQQYPSCYDRYAQKPAKCLQRNTSNSLFFTAKGNYSAMQSMDI